MKKTLITLVLVASMVLGCFSTIFAASQVNSGTCSGGQMNWTLDSEGTLRFSGSAKILYPFDDPNPRQEYFMIAPPWGWDVKKVIIPEGVEDIANFTFYRNGKITEVVFPSTLKRIGGYAFGEQYIEELNLPEGLKEIANFAFKENNIKKIILPESLESLGYATFEGNAVREIYIGANLRSLSLPIITSQKWLNSITVNPANKLFKEKDGVLYGCNRNTGEITEVLMASLAAPEVLILPETVQFLAEYVFAGNTKIQQVVIPEGVKRINRYGFYNMPNLNQINFPSSLETICEDAFYNTPSLKINADLSNVTTLETAAFRKSGLLSVVLSDKLENVTYGVFSECRNLKSIYIPASVKTIANGSFSDYNYDSVYYGGSEAEWQSRNFAQYFRKSSSIIFQSSEKVDTQTVPQFVPVGPDSVFTDVKNTDYFAAPVAWAVEQHITEGTSATTFSPNNKCTKAQIITFLWRACGSPTYPEINNSFYVDVKTSDYFWQATVWMVMNGLEFIDQPNMKFNPNEPCTRAMAMDYIWKYCYSPTSPAYKDIAFADVPKGASYYDAVKWANNYEITSGTSDTTFSPNATCTRAQIVTFLWRAKDEMALSQ